MNYCWGFDCINKVECLKSSIKAMGVKVTPGLLQDALEKYNCDDIDCKFYSCNSCSFVTEAKCPAMN